MKKLIKYIPNILTSLRILLTPLIIYLTFKNEHLLAIALIIAASITDFLDGFIARQYNLVSKTGSMLDTIADKLFGGTLILSLIIDNYLFTLLLISELAISIINMISYVNNKHPKTMLIGKIKTTSLFITLILGFISELKPEIKEYTNLLIIITTLLQMLSIMTYLKIMLKENKIEKKKEKQTNHSD